MTENMKKFIEQASKDGALKAELEALSKEFSGKEQIAKNKDVIEQRTIKIAAKYGFTLTGEDLKAENAELNEEQLKAVAGGGNGVCVCVVGGYGGGLGDDGKGTCICAVGGTGKDPNKGDDPKRWFAHDWCACLVGGGGSTGPEG